jgi:hypothetical protein
MKKVSKIAQVATQLTVLFVTLVQERGLQSILQRDRCHESTQRLGCLQVR